MKKISYAIAVILISLTIFFMVTIAFIGSRGFYAPIWMVDKFETVIGKSFIGSKISIGDIEVKLFKNDSFVSATLFKVVVEDSEAKQLAYLNELKLTFDFENLIGFNLKPKSLHVSNSTLVVTKNLDGDFSFEMQEAEEKIEIITYSDALDVIVMIEELLEEDALSNLSVFSAINTNIAFVDQNSGKTWWLNQGVFNLKNLEQKLSAQFSANLLYGDNTTARAVLKIVKVRGGEAKISANIENVSVNVLSDQVPTIKFLSKFDFFASLSVSAVVLDNGEILDIQGVLESGPGDVIFFPEGKKFSIISSKLYFEFDNDSESINIKQATLDTEYGSTTGFGNIFVEDKSDEEDIVIIGQLKFINTNLFESKAFVKDFEIDNLLCDFKFDFGTNTLKIGQLIGDHEDLYISSDGSFKFTNEGVKGSLKFLVSEIPAKALANLWPLVKGEKTKIWALENLSAGNLRDITGIMSFDPAKTNDFYTTFVFDKTGINLPENLSPVREASGTGELGINFFNMYFEEGHLLSETNEIMDLSGSSLRVLMGNNESPIMNIRLSSVASIPSTLEILKGLPDKFKISKNSFPGDLQGIFVAKTDIIFQLDKKLNDTEIIFSSEGELKSISIENIYDDFDITADLLTFYANNKEILFAGDLKFADNPISAKWNKAFDQIISNTSLITGEVILSKTTLDSLNFTLPEIGISNATVARFSILFSDDSKPIFKLESDLKGLDMKLKPMNWTKHAEDQGHLLIEGNLGLTPFVSRLIFSSDDLSINGRVYFQEDGKLDKISVSSLMFENWLDVSFELKKDKKNTFVFEILDGNIDLRNQDFSVSKSFDLTNFPETIVMENVIVSDNIKFTNFKMQSSKEDPSSGIFWSQINDGPSIEGLIKLDNNSLFLNINADDAGAVLRSLGVFENARKGDLNVILVSKLDEGGYHGDLTVKNTRVVDAPALAELLSAVSVIGLLEQMDGQGLVFSEGKANFSILHDEILIHDSSAIGASMGLTLQGRLSPQNDEIEANGVITPFYAVNGIFEQTGLFAGLLGSKKGEGVFGFNYEIQGVGKALNIEVNPLSILTPGVFRELFNSPMPERTQ